VVKEHLLVEEEEGGMERCGEREFCGGGTKESRV
jgi:hypothetical protein